MTWGYVVGAAIVYFVFQKKIKQIKAWIKRHKDLIERWKNEPEIMEAYEELKREVKAASLDRKWNMIEIIAVLGAAIHLFKLIKSFEEHGEG